MHAQFIYLCRKVEVDGFVVKIVAVVFYGDTIFPEMMDQRQLFNTFCKEQYRD